MIVHHHKYFLENGYIEVKGAPAVKLNKEKKIPNAELEKHGL